MKTTVRRIVPSMLRLLLIPALSMCGGGGDPGGPAAPVATKLAFNVQPPAAAVSGTAMAPSIVVTIQDASGATVVASTASVTLTITGGSGAGGAVLGGTTTRAAVGGLAAFSGITLDKAAAGYTLTASSAGLAGATSSSITVTAGAPARLVMVTQPGNAANGVALAPAVQIAIHDAAGNLTTATSNVTVAITTGTGAAGAVLGGTTTVAAVGGVATFSNLTVDLAGTGYTLTASSAGLTGVTTATFTITSATALTITKLFGDIQTALVAFATNVRPAVRITNASGPVAGTAVTFAVTGGGGSITGSATVNTNAQGIAQVASWIVGAGAGANTLTATGAGTFQGSNNVVFTTTAQTRQFNVEIRNIGPAFSPAVQTAFDLAEAFWESILFGDLSDTPVNTTNACGVGATINETVDDIIVLARFDSIDGSGNVLGSAGACDIVRTPSFLPVYGLMRFDTADVAGLIASNSLNAVILHEMGHVLGYSSSIFNLTTSGTARRTCVQLPSSGNAGAVVSQDTHLNCTVGPVVVNNARARFDSMGGTNYTGGNKVPLENCTGLNAGNTANCGGGTYNSHWRESVFDRELMTGFLSSGVPNPLSILTITAFEDLGYLVNYGAAQAYTPLTPFQAPSAARGSGGNIYLGDDEFRSNLVPVDAAGRAIVYTRRP